MESLSSTLAKIVLAFFFYEKGALIWKVSLVKERVLKLRRVDLLPYERSRVFQS